MGEKAPREWICEKRGGALIADAEIIQLGQISENYSNSNVFRGAAGIANVYT